MIGTSTFYPIFNIRGGVGLNPLDPDHWIVTAAGPKLQNMHQGVIARDDGWTIIGDNAITRYNEDWEVQASNFDPKGDINTVGDMIDSFEYNGNIRTVRTRNDTTDYIEAFDAETLVYKPADSVAFTAGPSFAGFSSCCLGPQGGMLYGVSQSATVIEKYNISTGQHVEDIPIGGTLSQCNGIHYRNGYFYFANRPNDLYRCAADGGGYELVLELGSYNGMDGLSGYQNDLHLLCDTGWEGVMKIVPRWDGVGQTTGQTSNNFVLNGTFESQNLDGWFNWVGSTAFQVVFGGAVGATPDSWIANGVGPNAFMYQAYVIPQQAWDSVDAGTATVDLDYSQFGSGSGSAAVTCFNEHFLQLNQYGYALTSVGWSAWSDRSVTNQTLPTGTRMLFVQMHGDANVYFDNVTCSVSW